jgi:replicative DNA helicase
MSAPLQAPHSIEAEQSVLGGLMLRNEAFGDIARTLSAADFFRADHQLIFGAIAEMIAARKVCDFVTLQEHLRNQHRLDEAGGPGYLGSLTSDGYSIANLLAYVGIVRERAVLRRLIAAGALIGEMGYRPEGRSPDELLEEAERLVFELRAARAAESAGLRPLSQYAPQVEADIDRMHKAGGGMGGISTGFRWLDRKTDGLHPGDLVIVAGRPGSGKSTFAMNIAANVTFQGGRRVDVFSMEMQGRQVAMRTLSWLSRVPMGRLRSGALQDNDWTKIIGAGASMRTDLIQIDETGALSPFELRARARRSAARGGLALIVVDYIQLMQVPGTRENRTNQVAQISGALKAMAKEFGVAVIALSQLSRANEKENRKPKLSDLRDSGGIEQDADVVLFIHREDDGTESAETATAEIIIGKQRDGELGREPMNFYGACSRFEEMTEGERQAHDNRRAPLAGTSGFARISDRKRLAAGDA